MEPIIITQNGVTYIIKRDYSQEIHKDSAYIDIVVFDDRPKTFYQKIRILPLILEDEELIKNIIIDTFESMRKRKEEENGTA